MPYLDEHLGPGETVVFRTRTHLVATLRATLLSVLFALVALVLMSSGGLSLITLVLLVLAGFIFVAAYIPYRTNEFGVTTQRVVIKTGWANVRTLELQLSKVEAVAVDQTWFGKANNFGTLIVTGSGGTKEAFNFIARPLDFRKAVQAQADTQAHAVRSRYDAPAPPSQVGARTSRQERDCPFCAESILLAARVCKHCGRDVPVMA